MTLRVRISVVPFGDEAQEREIHQINISNLEVKENGVYEYGIELNKYKTGDYNAKIKHYREDGAVALVNTALEKLLVDTEGNLK